MSISPKSVIVTGANRGIGLGIVRELLKNPEIQHIIATARDVEKATVLKSIQDTRLHILPLSVTCDESIDKLVEKVSEIVGSDGLNLLINNAGIVVKYSAKTVPNRASLAEQLDVNTISVVILTQKFLPLLKTAAFKVSGDNLSVARAAVVQISSGLGSITDNNIGSEPFEVLAYRMSKSALNQFNRTLAIDLKDDHILAVSFAPGWIQTDLGGPTALFTVEEATGTLVANLGKLNKSHNGGFFERDLSPRNF